MSSDKHEFICAMGDSHVRTFSFHSLFLPLYIGPGFDNNFLTDELAWETEEKLRLNLARLGKIQRAIFLFGEPDVRLHLENRFHTHHLGNSRAIKSAVGRYMSVMDAISCDFQFIPAIFNVLPSRRRDRHDLARQYNEKLATACRERGYVFLDIWSTLVDTNGDLLASEYDADGIHVNAKALPAIIQSLCRVGWVPSGFPLGSNYAWTFNYRIPMNARVETRFWGNKANTANADELVRLLTAGQEHLLASAAVLNCKEGYLAVALARAGISRVVAADESAHCRALANEITALSGLDGVQILEPRVLHNMGRAEPFGLVVDYDPDRLPAQINPEYLEGLVRIGLKAVVVAPKAILDRWPGLSKKWTIVGKLADKAGVEDMILVGSQQ